MTTQPVPHDYDHGSADRALGGLSQRESWDAGERLTPDELRRLSQCVRDSVVVHTDVPDGESLQLSGGRTVEVASGSFQTFGDGATDQGTKRIDEVAGYLRPGPGNHSLYARSGSEIPREHQFGVLEAVSFAPAVVIEHAVEAVTEKTGLLGAVGIARPQSRNVVHARPATTMNPLTGVEERAVQFAYAYNPHLYDPNPYAAESTLGVSYQETTGNRSGNQLIVSARLPESVARELSVAIEDSPDIARQVAEWLVLQHGGISPEQWNGQRPGHNRSRPPYEQLPSDRRLWFVYPFDWFPLAKSGEDAAAWLASARAPMVAEQLPEDRPFTVHQ